MAEEQEEQKTLWQRALDTRREWASKQPSFWAEIKAMTREAVKDVRNTMNEVFFGKQEHMAEQGTPLNPTPQMVTKQLGNVYGKQEPAKLAPVQDMGAVTQSNEKDAQVSEKVAEEPNKVAPTKEKPMENQEIAAPEQASPEAPAQETREAASYEAMVAEAASMGAQAQEQQQGMER